LLSIANSRRRFKVELILISSLTFGTMKTLSFQEKGLYPDKKAEVSTTSV